MRRPILAAAVLALAAVIPASAPPASAPSRPAGCYRVTVAQNSGAGPYLHWTVCYALPSHTGTWTLTNDASGSLGDGTVLMGPLTTYPATRDDGLAAGCQDVTVARPHRPLLHWVVCYAFRQPARGMDWQLADPSGSLGNGAVLLGEQVRDR